VIAGKDDALGLFDLPVDLLLLFEQMDEAGEDVEEAVL
jgi:hypothetical protein